MFDIRVRKALGSVDFPKRKYSGVPKMGKTMMGMIHAILKAGLSSWFRI
jgi:hypothetical protein